MAIRTAISPKIQPLVRRAVQNHGIRPMTVLSKQSGEEYKKQVCTGMGVWMSDDRLERTIICLNVRVNLKQNETKRNQTKRLT